MESLSNMLNVLKRMYRSGFSVRTNSNMTGVVS